MPRPSSCDTEAIAALLDGAQPGYNHKRTLDAAKAKPTWPDPVVFQVLYKAYSTYVRKIYKDLPSQKYRDAERNVRKAFLLEYANGVCDKVNSHRAQFERFCRCFVAVPAPQFSPDDINTWLGVLLPAQNMQLSNRIDNVRKALKQQQAREALEPQRSKTAGSSSTGAAVLANAEWVTGHKTRRPAGSDVAQLQLWRRAAFDPQSSLELPKKGDRQWINASFVQTGLFRRAAENILKVRTSGQTHAVDMAKHFLLDQHIREVCNYASKRRKDLLRHESRNLHVKLEPLVRNLKAIEVSLQGTSPPQLILYGWSEDAQHNSTLLDYLRQRIQDILK